jgi:hypothetical protein
MQVLSCKKRMRTTGAFGMLLVSFYSENQRRRRRLICGAWLHDAMN